MKDTFTQPPDWIWGLLEAIECRTNNLPIPDVNCYEWILQLPIIDFVRFLDDIFPPLHAATTGRGQWVSILPVLVRYRKRYNKQPVN